MALYGTLSLDTFVLVKELTYLHTFSQQLRLGDTVWAIFKEMVPVIFKLYLSVAVFKC